MRSNGIFYVVIPHKILKISHQNRSNDHFYVIIPHKIRKNSHKTRSIGCFYVAIPHKFSAFDEIYINHKIKVFRNISRISEYPKPKKPVFHISFDEIPNPETEKPVF